MPIEVDESRPPVLRLRYRGVIRNEDIEAVIQAAERWEKRARPYAMVIDTVGSEPIGAAQRRRLAEGVEKTGNKYLRGCAVVITSTVMRGVMTAVQWLAPPKFPVEIVATVEEAEALVHKQLEKR